MEFIKLVQSNGGVLNGSTRFDFTNYFEIVPSNALETALWAEADRMRGLAITQDNLKNQQGVVKSEVRVNVLNRPYGGFPWLDMPQYANTNWYNAHNFYGDLKDLDAATLEDVDKFFKTYYIPSNAALVVTGDFEIGPDAGEDPGALRQDPVAAEAAASRTSPSRSRRRRSARRRTTSSRPRPALAFAYHAPKTEHARVLRDGAPRGDPLWTATTAASTRRSCRKAGLTGDVNGGINPARQPVQHQRARRCWSARSSTTRTSPPDEILKVIDDRDREAAERARRQGDARPRARQDALRPLRQRGPLRVRPRRSPRELRALLRRPGDDQPRSKDSSAKVTPELLQKTAREYLAPSEPHGPRRSSRRPSRSRPRRGGPSAAAAQKSGSRREP